MQEEELTVTFPLLLDSELTGFCCFGGSIPACSWGSISSLTAASAGAFPFDLCFAGMIKYGMKTFRVVV